MPASNARLRARATPQEQIETLSEVLDKEALPSFEDSLSSSAVQSLLPKKLDILQINVGKMCNQTCKHCHVDAGPTRQEIMTEETMTNCLNAIDKLNLQTVDLTGGAPEMNPHFRWFVKEIRKRNVHVIVRCNLTILLAHPKYADLPNFYAAHQVEVIASLPHFMAKRTDAQRGKGVFDQSIKALQLLQKVGYGLEGSGLSLHLVYNPSGAFLPASQQILEKDFKQQLWNRYQIRFNHLFVVTNMPIARFFDYLEQSGNQSSYMRQLVSQFNAQTLAHLMCRNTLSVGWDGKLYDCDFNQMLDMETDTAISHIKDVDPEILKKRSIRTSAHCYGCTAGTGSSCGGSLT